MAGKTGELWEDYPIFRLDDGSHMTGSNKGIDGNVVNVSDWVGGGEQNVFIVLKVHNHK